VIDNSVVTERGDIPVRSIVPGSTAWVSGYIRRAAAADGACALLAGILASQVRFAGEPRPPAGYLALTTALPLLWWISVKLAGGYDPRFIGLGSDEFRRLLNAAVSLTAAVAVASYAAKLNLARGYIALALPTAASLDLTVRYVLRKHLHQLRRRGSCTRRVIAVGHAEAVAELITTLRRDSYHGLSVVGACVAGMTAPDRIAGVPVAGKLDSITGAVSRMGADTVAVLTCPEIDSIRLRELAWDLEKTGTDLCVAPALLDVAGPRTTIRPVAGLPLLHVDHPELAGGRQIVKSLFDKVSALLALILLAPAFAAIAMAVRCTDRGPALFRQTRAGKDGRSFTCYTFRTMVVDAEQQKALLTGQGEADGGLFKIRRDPRVTRTGAWLRRWSLDELPQLFNVLRGDMSLVGPGSALPEEAASYGDHMGRRIAVKPGITGLWKVNGRSDLAWEETVRLDIRYVENWSFALDLQILWKTASAVRHGSGACRVCPVTTGGQRCGTR
jgi:exopolysaccharide biosynthesis polyprenyl glycosylphosphotransferase